MFRASFSVKNYPFETSLQHDDTIGTIVLQTNNTYSLHNIQSPSLEEMAEFIFWVCETWSQRNHRPILVVVPTDLIDLFQDCGFELYDEEAQIYIYMPTFISEQIPRKLDCE